MYQSKTSYFHILIKYLVGKSDENEQSRFDIKKAVIPSEIIEIRRSAIQNKNKLSTLQFSESPFLKIIGQNVFNGNPITKLVLPDTIEEIDQSNFDEKFLLSKSQNSSFDKLIFVNRDVDRVQVPSFVKEIGPYAFRNCKKLKVLQFDENSVLYYICHHAFSFVDGLGCITIPASVTQVDYFAFHGNEGLHSITFLV